METGIVIEQGIAAIPQIVTRGRESRAKLRKEEIIMKLEKSVRMVNAVVGLLLGSGYTTPTERTLNQYPTVGLY